MSFRVSEADELNRLLAAEIAVVRSESPGLERSNQNGWHSQLDLFSRREPGFINVCAAILDAVRQATLQIAPAFDLKSARIQGEGWINVSGRGAFNAPHDHPGWAWSGSYYVVVPADLRGRSGAIEFLDPRTNARVVTVDGANCFASKVTILPEPGMLLLFPSFLRHWVYPNEADSERISIAFNARFAPKTAASPPAA